MRRYIAALVAYALILLGAVTAHAANPYSTNVLARSGLQAYWRMNDTAGCTSLADASANANNATIHGTVTCGSTALLTGDAGTSALFNGSTGYANPSSDTPFANTGTSPFTIAALIKAPAGAGEQAIFAKLQNTGTFAGYQFSVLSNKLDFRLVANFGGGDQISCVASATLTAGTFYWVAVTYDGSKTKQGITQYSVPLDGSAPTIDVCGSGTAITGSSATASHATIGARDSGAADFFASNIQELYFFNRALDNNNGTVAPPAGSGSAVELFQDLFGGGNRYLSADLAFPAAVIYDEDQGADSDDAGSLAALLRLQISGQISTLALTTTGNIDYGAAATFTMARFYGYSSIPIGPYLGSVGAGDAYASQVSTDFSYHHLRSDAAFFPNNAVTTMVNALCAQADGVTDIIEGGQLTNLDALLTLGSTTCGGNTYTGTQIISHKVHRFWIVAGIYPSGNEFNMDEDKTAASHFAANVPVETVAIGIELGNALGSAQPPSPPPASVNPILDAYTVSSLPGPRPLWSEIATTAAGEGLTRLGQTPCSASGGSGGYLIPGGILGTNTVNSSTGNNAWTTTAGQWAYMKFSGGSSSTCATHMQTYMTALLTPPSCSHMIGGGTCGVVGGKLWFRRDAGPKEASRLAPWRQ